MYLVHAHLEVPPGEQLPTNMRAVVRSAITAGDRVEHVAVHPRSPTLLTLGFYLLADGIEEAEGRAVQVGARLLRDVPQLAAARLTGAGVPLMPLAFAPQPVD
ncbi:hypothetical protein O1Q96_02535 [Streptomyces sp. Qhu-G9]|uniref:hypothetical protein n=1 Tax=Streptomyces sp. Qhu-G9 TaxID=3452799 RepID=UPI0022AC22EA|nr:hypothetical protein [Streptomyces aurantiacus]WAU78732.1 hypothetical protein O1Q96_02535 [Streptomyces aurantiacus]